ncbi:MAG: NMD3-related protein [Archaeoglobales archaeon]|nr:NMD3-related protein [Archaeoglobales archaeon]
MKCVVCGKETRFRICGSCLIERGAVAKLEKLNLEVCAKCNSIKIGGVWLNIPLEEAIERIVYEKLKVDPNLSVNGVKVEEKLIVLSGILNDDPVEISIPLQYKLHRISCPRCSMESGGYYEAIVQLRAVKRVLREDEIRKAEEIVQRSLSESEGEKEFLSKFEKTKNGIDFYFGSKKLGEKISRRISTELGGRIFESRKLHTRVDGRDSYRFTFLVRLPEYEDNDIVIKNESLYVVKNAKMSRGLDLLTGKSANIIDAKVAVKRSDLDWGVITNLDESSAEIMTEKGDIVLVQRPFRAEIGKEVFVFEYKNRNYAFPRDL